MAKRLRMLCALVLLASITIQADPFQEWSWTGPNQYENGSAIPSTDNLIFTLKCGIAQGGPYDRFEAVLQKPPPDTLDMGLLVQGQPGSYFCVATATSTLYNAESDPSNEVNFTVLPSDLGLRPKPPVLNLSQ